MTSVGKGVMLVGTKTKTVGLVVSPYDSLFGNKTAGYETVLQNGFT